MHHPMPATNNPFSQEAPSRGDSGPNPDPWIQAEIDRLRQRNATLADTLATQTDELKRLRGVLAELKERTAAMPVSEAVALVCLDRGLCSRCWRSAIPACGCNRG